jgi:hypothetical protein
MTETTSDLETTGKSRSARRHRKLVVGIAVSVVLLAVAAPLYFFLTAESMQQKFERISRGITVDEVEAIIGMPEGDYRTFPVFPRPCRADSWAGSHRFWKYDEGTVSILFQNDEVYFKQWLPNKPMSWWQRLRLKLRLEWNINI